MNAIIAHTKEFKFYLAAWCYAFQHRDKMSTWSIEHLGLGVWQLRWTEIIEHQVF